MRSVGLFAVALCLSLACSLLTESVSHAQHQTQTKSETWAQGARPLAPEERLLLRDQWVRQRERDRSEIGVAGPIVGIVVGVGLLSLEAWMIARLRGSAALGIALPIVTLFSLPTLILSAVVLKRRLSQRRAIEREIWGHRVSINRVGGMPVGVTF